MYMQVVGTSDLQHLDWNWGRLITAAAGAISGGAVAILGVRRGERQIIGCSDWRIGIEASCHALE